MFITINNLDIDKLEATELADYIIVGDASSHARSNKAGWASVITDAKGNGELIYGVQTGVRHAQLAELLPIYNALQVLASRNDASASAILNGYNPRVNIITDCVQLVYKFYGAIAITDEMQGGFAFLNSYKTIFNIRLTHMPRRSHPLLSLVDTLARTVVTGDKSTIDVINNVIGQAKIVKQEGTNNDKRGYRKKKGRKSPRVVR